MGQKVNPIGFRLGFSKFWLSSWYATGSRYVDLLLEDFKIREFLKKKLKTAAVSKIIIERSHKNCVVSIHSARPGFVIGKKGNEIGRLKKEISTFTKSEVHINLIEVQKPEIDATLVAESIATKLERRGSFRSAARRAMQMAFRFGVKGIRIVCSGRLGGVDIARDECYLEGSVPLHTLRADIDFAKATAATTYGSCGVKVWIFKGEILSKESLEQVARPRKKTAPLAVA